MQVGAFWKHLSTWARVSPTASSFLCKDVYTEAYADSMLLRLECTLVSSIVYPLVIGAQRIAASL